MQAHFFMFLQHFSASTRLKKSGPACKSWHGKQDSGSKSFEVVSWPQLGPYENNSIHPLLPQGLCKPISSCFCNTSVPAQDSRNLSSLQELTWQAKNRRSSDKTKRTFFQVQCFVYIQLLPSVIGLFSTPPSRGIKLYEFRFSIIAVSVSWPRVKRKPRWSMKL